LLTLFCNSDNKRQKSSFDQSKFSVIVKLYEKCFHKAEKEGLKRSEGAEGAEGEKPLTPYY
jgi:hypothetical protein